MANVNKESCLFNNCLHRSFTLIIEYKCANLWNMFHHTQLNLAGLRQHIFREDYVTTLKEFLRLK